MTYMGKDAKILVVGAGMVGSAILRRLEKDGYDNVSYTFNSKKPIEEFNNYRSLQVDLKDPVQVEKLFNEVKPEFVFLSAAKVGGIYANSTYPAEFISTNLDIQQNVIKLAFKYNVDRLLFLGSSCIYPKECPQPIKEEYLLTGPLELTNRPYAIAKIAGIEMCWAYNRQFGTKYLSVMPTNLYGPNDNYDLNNSHVLPALIRKFHEAKENNLASVSCWGSGRPRREFLHADDMASACIFVLNLPPSIYNGYVEAVDSPPLINIGCGEDVSIKDLADKIRKIVGFKGEILWDSTKPDGTMKKLLDVGVLKALGWEAEIALIEGVKEIYTHYTAKFMAE
ncbi:GDP-L-fucose synthase family protein [Fangia hongkongensis]|uniref:GDP-L-fucose synthase family protein n=1 Tax=Fangia hongkongensis TaxID=270495 RepID=UPI00035DE168